MTAPQPVELRAARVARDGPQIRAMLAESLRTFTTYVVRDELDRPVIGYALVLVTEGGAPIVTWEQVSWDELLDAVRALSDAYHAHCRGRPGDELNDHVAEQWEHYRELARAERERVDRARREKPWECEAPRCGRRFTTERGARQHEQRCHQREERP